MDPLARNYPSLSPYNYAANNPIILYDPDGRLIWGAIIGAGVDFGMRVAVNLTKGQDLASAVKNVDYTSVAVSAGAGLISGGVSALVKGKQLIKQAERRTKKSGRQAATSKTAQEESNKLASKPGDTISELADKGAGAVGALSETATNATATNSVQPRAGIANPDKTRTVVEQK